MMVDLNDDNYYMNLAWEQAKRSLSLGDVPVGALVFGRGRIWGVAGNERSAVGDPLGHAEVLAIRNTVLALGDWRLNGFTLYVTMEPCPMCAGLILQTRMERVVFGVPSIREGCAGSVLNLLDYPGMAHHVDVKGGVLKEEISATMQEFFSRARN